MTGRTPLAALAVPLVAAAIVPAGSHPRLAADDPKPAANEPAASVSVRFAEVWDHKALAPVRGAAGGVELAWAVRSLVGLAPDQIDRLTVLWPTPGQPVAVLTTRKPFDAAEVARALVRDPQAEVKTLPGGVLHAPGAEFAYARRVDDKTLVLATAATDPKEVATVVAPEAPKHTFVARFEPRTLDGLPAPLGELLAGATAATLTVDLKAEAAAVRLAATYPDAAAAKAGVAALRARLDDLAGWAKAREKEAAERIGEGSAYPAPLLDWLATTLKAAKVAADGREVVATAAVKPDELVGRVLMAVPDSALAAGRGSGVNENNLKQIALAFHNYHDANGQFPANTYTKDGKPLLSWRVHILPYIEQDNVYKQFKLDEPWDSPHNKPLGEVLLKVYTVPGRPADQPHHTYYRAFVAPKDAKPEHRPLMVEGREKGMKIETITDGSSNTFMVVEAGEAVPWSKPDDLLYDGEKPLPRLGGPNGTFAAAMCDGSVRTFRRARFPDQDLRAAITAAGGEVFNFPAR